jgi:hypothetical protein
MSETGNSEGRATLHAFSPEVLATELELDGVVLRLNTDWRDIKYIVELLNNPSIRDEVRAQALIEIFYDNAEDIRDPTRALAALYNFIDCGEPPSRSAMEAPKMMDWKIDFSAIISDMNKVSKCEDIRALPYMHWFTFVSIYHAIGEGNLSYRMGIRKKLRKNEKLTPEEREWVRCNPDKAFIENGMAIESD